MHMGLRGRRELRAGIWGDDGGWLKENIISGGTGEQKTPIQQLKKNKSTLKCQLYIQ